MRSCVAMMSAILLRIGTAMLVTMGVDMFTTDNYSPRRGGSTDRPVPAEKRPDAVSNCQL